MKVEKIHSLRAKELVFPFIRPLASIFASLRELDDAGCERPAPAIAQEFSDNVTYIVRTLEKLLQDAGLEEEDMSRLMLDLQEIENWSGKRQDMIRNLNAVNEGLTGFCTRNKSALRSAYNGEKDYYRDLFRELIGIRCVTLLYGRNKREDAETVSDTLSKGCYYDVKLEPATGFGGRSSTGEIVAVYSHDLAELNSVALTEKRPGVDVMLLNLGKDMNAVNPTLLRIATSMQKKGVRVIYRPFSTLRLLDGIEHVYYRAAIADQVMEAEAAAQPRTLVEIAAAESINLLADPIVRDRHRIPKQPRKRAPEAVQNLVVKKKKEEEKDARPN